MAEGLSCIVTLPSAESSLAVGERLVIATPAAVLIHVSHRVYLWSLPYRHHRHYPVRQCHAITLSALLKLSDPFRLLRSPGSPSSSNIRTSSPVLPRLYHNLYFPCIILTDPTNTTTTSSPSLLRRPRFPLPPFPSPPCPLMPPEYM